MKKIELSKRSKIHKGKYFALVDDEDFDELNKYNWAVLKHGKIQYAVRTKIVDGKRIPQKMHRVILGLTDPSIFGDHIDGDGLNNQRHNIRKSTNSENQKNKRACGKSKYLGVSIAISKKKRMTKKYGLKTYVNAGFIAQLQVKNKTIYLGQYKTEEEAALAYNEGAKKYHGEYARLNIIK